MWKTFSADDNIYILKFTNINGIYKICISDLEKFWCDEYEEERLVQTFQECNPTVLVKNEASEKILFQILKFFHEIDKAEVTIASSNDKIDVNMKTGILGLSDTNFNIKYKLTLIKADKFKEEVTIPMIHTIHFLENQKKMLCNLIDKKDRELEEYKMEKGPISRLDLTTEKFNSEAVGNSNDKLMLNVYSQSNKFWDTFINEYGDIEEKVMDVNVESWNHIKKKKKIYNSITAGKRTCENICYKDK